MERHAAASSGAGRAGSGSCPFGPDPNRLGRQEVRDIVMKRTVLRMLAAATATAALSGCRFHHHRRRGQSDEQPTHAELVQRWAEAGIDAQLKGMKTSLRLTADQEEDWGLGV